MANNQNNLGQRLALGLAWFSIGLGLAQILAPRRMAQTVGMKKSKSNTLMRMLGAREITSGIGILTQRKTSKWLLARVAGDAMDLAILGSAFSSKRSDRNRVIAATAAVAGVSALDLYCSRQLSRNGSDTKKIQVRKSITIGRSPEDLYEFWRHFDRLPVIMNHLVSVEPIGHDRWHWVAKAPAGKTVEWDAELIEDDPNELIAWRSLKGSQVDNAGVIQFERAPAGRGTIVHVELEYSPPAGMIGAKIAKLFHVAPEQQIGIDLRRFKQLMETGEIARTEGQSAGRATSTSKKYDDYVRA
ncbi:MAG: SRPBCC family protein [Verrucomicrobia bacterium]|nr:SRPBCC family protein [Verrucomicrobiota bacterium]